MVNRFVRSAMLIALGSAAVVMAAAPEVGPTSQPGRPAIKAQKADGTMVSGDVQSWDVGGLKVLAADGRAAAVAWKELTATEAMNVLTQMLSRSGTGRQWLLAGQVLASLEGGKTGAELAYTRALSRDKTLEIDVNDARDALLPPPDPAKLRGGVTTASAPDCSNIINLRQVGPDHFEFQSNSKLFGIPESMQKAHAARVMPDPRTAHGWGHFCLRLDQTASRPVVLDVRAWNASKDARVWYSYVDPDTPAAYERTDGVEAWQELKASARVDRSGTERAWSTFDLRTRFEFQPRRSPVWVASSYPYTGGYQAAMFAELQSRATTRPAAKVIDIATTEGGRVLQLVRIAEGEAPLKDRPTILLYGGEHATETVGCRAASRAIEFLAGDSAEAVDARRKCVFLVLPMLDPDGAANGWFNQCTSAFVPQTQIPHVQGLARFLIDWVNAGHRLDLAISLHSSFGVGHADVEPAAVWEDNLDSFRQFQKRLKARLGERTLAEQPWVVGGTRVRLCDWCEWTFGSLYLGYEINESNDLARLDAIARGFVLACSDYSGTPDSAARAKDFRAWEDKRRAALQKMADEVPGWTRRNSIEVEYFLDQYYLRPSEQALRMLETVKQPRRNTPTGGRS